ncbi:MAG: ATP-dependent helicase [Hydrogenophaga sp.]|nr:ATP-dependent helicase [Hydrogenophaga sp.]
MAAPGSGKTEVSARRIAALLSLGLTAPNLLVLSFSRSAVRTLIARLSRLDGLDEQVLEELRHVSIRTFDSWTFRMLRRLGEDSDVLLRRSHNENIAALVDILRSQHAAEIGKLLKGVRHILIDEVQDLAGVRGDLVFELLRIIAPPSSNTVGFTLLGDPAQSIYGFGLRSAEHQCLHGATTAELLAAIRSEFAHVMREVPLDRNYRSVPHIASFLEQLRGILRSDTDGAQKLAQVTEALAGLPAADFPLDDTLFNSCRSQSIALLARTNGEVLRVAQKVLGTEVEGPGIALQIGSGDPTAAPAWVAALLASLRSGTLTRQQFTMIHARAAGDSPETFFALAVPPVDVAWQRLTTAAGTAIEAPSLIVSELAKRMSWPDAFPDDEGVADSGLCISTIHQSKGREFDLVAIMERDPNRTPAESDPEEEACVGFVALSRAAKRVVRLPADSIYAPPSMREFGHGTRKRLVWWRNGWVNMEMGISGDVVPESFANVAIHGSDEAVAENYRFLAVNSRTLIGHKVMLRKTAIPGSEGGKARYEICLQDGKQPGRLLGAMHQNLVYDLLGLLHSHGLSLPKLIMNLRIARVVSVASHAGAASDVSSLFASSGMWLGVELFGTGDFRTFARG